MGLATDVRRKKIRGDAEETIPGNPEWFVEAKEDSFRALAIFPVLTHSPPFFTKLAKCCVVGKIALGTGWAGSGSETLGGNFLFTFSLHLMGPS